MMHTPHPRRYIPVVLLLAVLAFSTVGSAVRAADGAATTAAKEDVTTVFKPGIGIPDSQFARGATVVVTGTTLGEYISALYVFLSGAVGVVAALMVLYGGFKWIVASGNTGRVDDAKQTINAALIALLLTLGAYTLLYTINPELVRIQDLSSYVKPIARIEQEGDLLKPADAEPEAFVEDPGLKAAAKPFQDEGCPKNAEEARAPFSVYVTGYYKPGWNYAGAYESFACNLATQCWCDQKSKSNNLPYCHDKRGREFRYRPCTEGWLQSHRTQYCNDTAMPGPTPPNGPYGPETTSAKTFTAAAGKGCFGFGTIFRLQDAGKSRIGFAKKAFEPSTTWEVMDRGAESIIRGRHIDLYMGAGEQQARPATLGVSGEAVMQVLRWCPPGAASQDDCTNLAPEAEAESNRQYRFEP